MGNTKIYFWSNTLYTLKLDTFIHILDYYGVKGNELKLFNS